MKRKPKELSKAESEELMRAHRASKNATCVICHRSGTRVGMQGDRICADVMCVPCFENAPSSFKLTPAQDVFRSRIWQGKGVRQAMYEAEKLGNFEWRWLS